jgi:hypothetical protein
VSQPLSIARRTGPLKDDSFKVFIESIDIPPLAAAVSGRRGPGSARRSSVAIGSNPQLSLCAPFDLAIELTTFQASQDCLVGQMLPAHLATARFDAIFDPDIRYASEMILFPPDVTAAVLA